MSARPSRFDPEPLCPAADALARGIAPTRASKSGAAAPSSDPSDELWGFKAPHSIFYLSFYQVMQVLY